MAKIIREKYEAGILVSRKLRIRVSTPWGRQIVRATGHGHRHRRHRSFACPRQPGLFGLGGTGRNDRQRLHGAQAFILNGGAYQSLYQGVLRSRPSL